jgi:trehalose 6-phosphate phosphatase
MAGHTSRVSAAATLTEALAPIVAEPPRSGILLDVDGTLAPIVRHASDAQVPESTRGLLIRIARRYGLVACVSGRRAADARRIVAIGSLLYVGNHGGEVLRPGASEPEMDPELAGWARRVQEFAAAQARSLGPARVRVEDKDVIVAFHWRGAPDEAAARELVEEVARRAEDEGLAVHWGRKVLEVRPPVRLDKGAGVVALLQDRGLAAALYAGDDATDLDAFRGLQELVETGALEHAVRVGVRSDEGPSEVVEAADVVVEGPSGVRLMLEALLQGA